jgi:DNA-binding CsgD family transcriptional regulator
VGADVVALSAREKDILRGILAERTYAKIGQDLGVQYETVRKYARRLRNKTGIRTRAGLAAWAVQYKILGDE